MKTKVLTLDAADAGEIELNDSIFGLDPRTDLIQRVVVWQLAKRRAGTHKTLTRGEVNRTTKKWYRQKGTGSARHGARSAPLFVGGGKAMAPKMRDHEYHVPKKVRRAAIRAAISKRNADKALFIVKEWKFEKPSTKLAVNALAKLGFESALIIDEKGNELLFKSVRNAKGYKFLPPEGANVFDILNHHTLVLTEAGAKALEGALQ